MDWKTRILTWLTAIAGIATILGGLDLTEILPLLPDHIAAMLTLALPVVITVGKIAVAIGDLLDDGLRNNSFKVGLMLLLAVLLAAGMTSCVASIDAAGDWAFRTDPAVVGRVLDHVLIVDDKSSK